jgi:hypothetical protein
LLQAAKEDNAVVHLNAALEEKQKEIVMTSEERDLAQKRLKNLEQLILGGQGRSIGVWVTMAINSSALLHM